MPILTGNKQKVSSKSQAIVCRNGHANEVLNSVLCLYCQIPLFKVRWWYHAIVLNLAIIGIGFSIGASLSDWISFVALEGLLVSYWIILFRKSADNLIMGLLLLLVTFLQVFLSKYGDFGIPYLMGARTVLLYALSAVAITVYISYWYEQADRPNVGILRSLSALSLGLFITVFLIEQMDTLFEFLDPVIGKVLRNHLYFRTLLLAATAIHLLSYSAAKSIQNQITVPQFELPVPTGLWTPLVKRRHKDVANQLIQALRPIINILMGFLRGFIEIVVAISNFVVKLVLIIIFRVVDYSKELLRTIEAVLAVLVKALRSFLRYLILPLVLFYLIHLLLIRFTEMLVNHIRQGSLVADAASMLLVILELNACLILLVWLVSDYKPFDTIKSVIFANASLSLLLLLYSAIASVELWLISQWRPELPFVTFGNFTLVTIAVILLTSVVVFTMGRLRHRAEIHDTK